MKPSPYLQVYKNEGDSSDDSYAHMYRRASSLTYSTSGCIYLLTERVHQ